MLIPGILAASARRPGLADFFANVGGTGPFYSEATYPAAFQDSTGKTRLFMEAWTGSIRMMRTLSYDHSTGQFGAYRPIAVGVLTDDEHGVLAACEDHEGYIHVFGNAHNTPLYGYSSFSPITSVDDPDYAFRNTFGTQITYPKPVLVGSSIWLFYREYIGSGIYRGMVRNTSSLSSGVPTWTSSKIMVDFGTARVYFGNAIKVGTDIHIVATRADSSDTERKGVYYFVLDTTTGDVSNFAGTTTVLSANLPVDLTTANASFRIFDHGSNRGNIPYLAFDSNSDPHITFTDGSGTTFNFKHIMHNGSAWTSPQTIAPTTGIAGNGATGSCAIVPLAGGAVAFHYADNSAGIYRGEAGDWKTRTRDAGGTLGPESTVLIAGTAKIARTTGVVNPHADLRVFASEIAPSPNNADAGGLRMYGYGDSGLIGPAPLNLDSDASTLISSFANEPVIERKLTINDLIIRLKRAGVWAKLDALWLFAAHDSDAALKNWKNPGTHDITLHGTANPTFTANSGFATDGVDNYLNTNFNPATAGGSFTQNSAVFGIWSATSAGSNSSKAGWADGSDGTVINPRNASSTGRMQLRINQSTSVNEESDNIVGDGTGLYTANRSASNALQGYRNGTQIITGTTASVALNSAPFRLGSVTSSAFVSHGFRGAMVGASLSSSEQSSLFSHMLEYLRQVGAESI